MCLAHCFRSKAAIIQRHELSATMLTKLPHRSLSRFFTNLLVRLLIVTSLPPSIQPYTALLPVSMLWTLVRHTSSEVDGARTTTFTWDANGNQTSKTVGGVTTTYSYDARDKLIEAKQGADTLSRYSYDFEGRRNLKIGAPGADPTDTLRQYVYDQTSILAEYNASGAEVAKYDYGSDRLVSLTYLGEGRRYYSFDALRSVTNLTDDAGATVASYHLDAWGNFRFPDERAASANRFAFTGYEWDQETGLYNAKARVYDPEVGRFITQDSYLGQIDDPPSLHRYFYANDRPTYFVDPTGHQSVPVDQKDLILQEAQRGMAEFDRANPQMMRKTESLQNSNEPTIVEEVGGNTEGRGFFADLWNKLTNSEEAAKQADRVVTGMSRDALNADRMSDESADRARALLGSDQLPSGMREQDIINLSQGDRGAVRSGVASAAGGFAGVGVYGAMEAWKQYAAKKATEAVAAVVGAGTRLARVFRRGSGAAEVEVAATKAASTEARALETSAPSRRPITDPRRMLPAGSEPPSVGPPAGSRHTRFVEGVRVVDRRTGTVLEGTADVQPTLDRIAAGRRFPHRNDGAVFQNRPLPGRSAPELPVQPRGYYTEYVHPTPGVRGPGPQRIVIGQGGEMYYTPDHYQTFIPIGQR